MAGNDGAGKGCSTAARDFAALLILSAYLIHPIWTLSRAASHLVVQAAPGGRVASRRRLKDGHGPFRFRIHSGSAGRDQIGSGRASIIAVLFSSVSRECALRLVVEEGKEFDVTTHTGTSGNDVIDGGNGTDIIYGRDGDDIIFGGNGGDTLDGGDGNDQLYGENGNEHLYRRRRRRPDRRQ